MPGTADAEQWERLASIRRIDTRSERELLLLEGILLSAQLAGDTDLEIIARVQWMRTSRTHSRADSLRLDNLLWCLAWIDEHPGELQPELLRTAIWDIKGRLEELSSNPDVPLAQIDELSAAYERHVRASGGSMHSVHSLRTRIAVTLGDDKRAAAEKELRDTFPRDRFSDCRGCELTVDVYLAMLGDRREEAVEMIETYFASTEFQCEKQPHTLQSASLLPLTSLGRAAEARPHAIDAWSMLAELKDDPTAAGLVIHWYAATGQTQRTLELIEEYAPEGLTNEWGRIPGHRLYFLASAAYALHLLTVQGHGDRRIIDEYVCVLAARWEREARALAARFDARNGTAAITRRLERILDPESDEFSGYGSSTRRRPTARGADSAD